MPTNPSPLRSHVGELYMYIYDENGNDLHDPGSESLIVYNNNSGLLAVFSP